LIYLMSYRDYWKDFSTNDKVKQYSKKGTVAYYPEGKKEQVIGELSTAHPKEELIEV